MNRRQFLKTATATAAGILLGTNYAEAQNNQLSPQQQETVAKLRLHGSTIGGWRQMVNDVTDPILVGRHVVLTTEWLELVGDGKGDTVTRQQFQEWRDRIDNLYECYEKFVGHRPIAYPIILIHYRSIPNLLGSASGGYVSIARNHTTTTHQGMRLSNGLSSTMMHEMAHNFINFSRRYNSRGELSNSQVGLWFNTDPGIAWFANVEAECDFLGFYAVENCGFRTPGATGSTLRRNKIQRLLQNFRDNNLVQFRGDGPGVNAHAHSNNNAYEFYLCQLVDVAGWETFGRTIQSYSNGTFTPTKIYTPDSEKSQRTQHVRAHQFFDRLAHFHDLARQDPQQARNIPAAGRNLTGEQALRSLPDRGRLLDEHFTVATTPIAGAAQNTGRVAPTATPPPRVQPTAIPPATVQPPPPRVQPTVTPPTPTTTSPMPSGDIFPPRTPTPGGRVWQQNME